MRRAAHGFWAVLQACSLVCPLLVSHDDFEGVAIVVFAKPMAEPVAVGPGLFGVTVFLTAEFV